MTSVSETEVAWELLACHRQCLTVAEWHAVSINLAIGEHQMAVHDILTAVVREREPITASIRTATGRGRSGCTNTAPP